MIKYTQLQLEPLDLDREVPLVLQLFLLGAVNRGTVRYDRRTFSE